MNTIKFILICFFMVNLVVATEQAPDILIYDNKKLTLNTGWGHPSPLQTYYEQNKIKYPFKMISTANYRGHIAVWEIEEDKLYLNEIQIEDSKYKPGEFAVRSIDSISSTDKHVFSDWFNGVIEGHVRNKKDYWVIEKSYYFYVKDGKVIDTQTIDEKDYKQIEKISEKDTSNHSLMAKYRILILNQNYIAYYFRLYDDDKIIYNNMQGLFSSKTGISPLLLYYKNNHIVWPFNWENFEKNGAPNCIWLIDEGKLYLTQINLLTGLDFYSIDSIRISLDEIFKDKIINHRVFSNWVSGVFLIKYGEEVENEMIPGYKEFKASNYTYLRINSGIVEESYQISSDFNFKEIPPKTDPKLIKLINDFKNKN